MVNNDDDDYAQDEFEKQKTEVELTETPKVVTQPS
jgi:hypothetical protein